MNIQYRQISRLEFIRAGLDGVKCVFVVSGKLRREGFALHGFYYWSQARKYFKTSHGEIVS